MVSTTVSVPVSAFAWLGRLAMPPVIVFGSPVQRAQDERESFWHVPVTIHPGWRWGAHPKPFGPATMVGCEVFLDYYPAGRVQPDTVRMGWGDQPFQEVSASADLRRRHPRLVPIAWRSEVSGDLSGYFADLRFLLKQERHIPIRNDWLKHRFKLRIKSGSFERVSPHFYQVRAPIGRSNGGFTVEVEYEGEGTR